MAQSPQPLYPSAREAKRSGLAALLPRPTHSHVPLSLRDCCCEVPTRPCSKDHTGPGHVENRATAESDYQRTVKSCKQSAANRNSGAPSAQGRAVATASCGVNIPIPEEPARALKPMVLGGECKPSAASFASESDGRHEKNGSGEWGVVRPGGFSTSVSSPDFLDSARAPSVSSARIGAFPQSFGYAAYRGDFILAAGTPGSDPCRSRRSCPRSSTKRLVRT